MEYTLCAYTIWHCGKRTDAAGNPHQEDSIFPAHGAASTADRLFILCDGMGGHEAGEVASATVCAAMSKTILTAEGAFTDDVLSRALTAAYDALDAKDDGTAVRKMGTTMTLLKLHSAGATIAHIGDSRVYHLRPGRSADDTTILFRTDDHSLVNELVKAGELTAEEAKHSRQKNVITRAMQPNLEHRPKADVYHTADIRPGDYFYLCSDGMLENMDDRQLCYFFSREAGDDERKVASLLNATQENSDNHSAIIVHITAVANPKATTAARRASDKSPARTSKRARGLVGIGLFLLVCVAVAATIALYPPPAAPPAETEELLEEKDKPFTNPLMPIPPPAATPATPAPTPRIMPTPAPPAPAETAATAAADTSTIPAPQVVSEEAEAPAADSIDVAAPTKEQLLKQAAKAAGILNKDKDKETNAAPPSEETVGTPI